jgi:hypothetical protein
MSRKLYPLRSFPNKNPRFTNGGPTSRNEEELSDRLKEVEQQLAALMEAKSKQTMTLTEGSEMRLAEGGEMTFAEGSGVRFAEGSEIELELKDDSDERIDIDNFMMPQRPESREVPVAVPKATNNNASSESKGNAQSNHSKSRSGEKVAESGRRRRS